MAPTVEVRRGRGRPPGSKNKPKEATPPIDDGMDDDDDQGEFEGIDPTDEEVEDVEDVDDVDDVEEPDDEDLNLPKDYVEDALRNAPKKAPLKPEPLPEKPKAADKKAAPEVDLKPVTDMIKALTLVVGGLEEKITGPSGFGNQANFGGTPIHHLEKKVDTLHKKVDDLAESFTALHEYLKGALGDASAKTTPVAKKSEEEKPAAKKASGLSDEDKAKLAKYIAAVYRNLKVGKKYALKSVISNTQERLGFEIATPSRVQAALEEHGIRIVDKAEGYFTITAEEE